MLKQRNYNEMVTYILDKIREMDISEDDKKTLFAYITSLESKYFMEMGDAQRWIPCSERLPKPNEVVLLCGQYNMLCGYINDEGRWYSMSGDGWETDMEFPDKGKIIAWMPLPEPFREGESE